MGCSFVAPIQNAVGKVVKVASNVVDKAITALPLSKKEATDIAKVAALGVGAYYAAPYLIGTSGATAALPAGGMTATGTGGMLGTTSGIGGLTGEAISAGMGGASTIPGMAAGSLTDAAINAGISGAGAASAAAGGGLLSTIGGYANKGAGYINDILGTSITGADLLGGGATLLGGYLDREAAIGAANDVANAQRLAAQQSKFRPVGVSTRFGSSIYGYDAQGNLVRAGYIPSYFITNQQNQLEQGANQALAQALASKQATAPMAQGAQSMFNLGQGYLASSPQEQAAKWMQDQQALLASSRAAQLAALQNKQLQQGRTGLAVGGNAGMMATNPEMAAYYNALAQQDMGLAANATQAGQQYAQFGAGMFNQGANTLQNMYGTQNAAYSPYTTAMDALSSNEKMAQQPLAWGLDIGKTMVQPSQYAASQIVNAAQTMQPVNSRDPWAQIAGAAGDYLLRKWV